MLYNNSTAFSSTFPLINSLFLKYVLKLLLLTIYEFDDIFTSDSLFALILEIGFVILVIIKLLFIVILFTKFIAEIAAFPIPNTSSTDFIFFKSPPNAEILLFSIVTLDEL